MSRALSSIVLAVGLAALAATLSGCGGGSDEPDLDKDADFVSQSVEGTVSGTGVLSGSTVSFDNQRVSIYIDADAMNIAMKIAYTVQGTETAKKMEGTAQFIITPEDKTVRAANSSLVTINSKQIREYDCYEWVVDWMPTADLLHNTIKGLLVGHKATGKDGKYRKFETTQDVAKLPAVYGEKATGTVDIYADMDNDNVLRKASVDLKMQTPHKVNAKSEFTGSKVSAGTPDKSNFQKPVEWPETCHKMPSPAPPAAFGLLPAALVLPVDMPLAFVLQEYLNLAAQSLQPIAPDAPQEPKSAAPKPSDESKPTIVV